MYFMFTFAMSLQFVIRSEVLKLYRDLLRAVKQIPDEYYRKEMRQWARDDFKKNKHLTDEVCLSCLCFIKICFL